MAKNYNDKVEDGINELIAILSSKKNWPYPTDEPQIKEIIEDLRKNEPIKQPIRPIPNIPPVDSTNVPEQPEKVTIDICLNSGKLPSLNCAPNLIVKRTFRIGKEPTEICTKCKPPKIEQKIIIRNQKTGVITSKFIQGDIIQIDAVVTQGAKITKDFKIGWLIKDISTDNIIPTQNTDQGPFAGDPAQQLINTNMLNYGDGKKQKKIEINLGIFNIETNEVEQTIKVNCTITPNPEKIPPKEGKEKEIPIPEDKNKSWWEKFKNKFRKKKPEETKPETGEKPGEEETVSDISVMVIEDNTHKTKIFSKNGMFIGAYETKKSNIYHFTAVFEKSINPGDIKVTANITKNIKDIWRQSSREVNRWLLGAGNSEEKIIVFKFEKEEKVIKIITIKLNFLGTGQSLPLPSTEETPTKEKEIISLNLFSEEGDLMSGADSKLITLRPETNAYFRAITTPANLVEQRKLKYKWALINSNTKQIIELTNATNDSINYAFLYGKVSEGIWDLKCNLIATSLIFRKKVILSAKGSIIKPKTEGKEEIPSLKERNLNPEIIRIYHGKELPKRKKGK